MRLLKILLSFALFLHCSVGISFAEPVSVKSGWLDEMETFPAWYAHKNKLDIAEGIDLSLKPYSAGRILIDSHISEKWKIGACGLVPALNGVLSKDLVIIAIGADESAANIILGRPNEKLSSVKGENPQYPDVYGSPQLLKGTTIICPLGSNSHSLLLAWLDLLGADKSLVSIHDVSPTEVAQAFLTGLGDAASIWIPSSTQQLNDINLQEDYVTLVSGASAGISLQTVLLADAQFVKENPEQVQAFVNAYFKAIAALKTMDKTTLLTTYKEFKKEWGNTNISDAMAQLELDTHTLFTREEQTQIQSNPQNPKSIQSCITESLPFVANVSSMNRRDVTFLQEFTYIVDTFLKQ